MAASTQEASLANATTEDSESQMRYFRGEDLPVLWALVVYVGPFLMILGTVGNSTIIIVLSRAIRLKQRTTRVYPITIASLSILAVNLRLMDHILTMHGLDIRSLNYPTCKVVTSVLYGATGLQLWVGVNLAMERVFALYSRSRGLFENDSHTICLFLVTTGLIVVSINVTYVPTYEQHHDSLAWACDAGDKYYSKADGWFWVQYLMLWALPTMLMLLCSILVGARLVYSCHRKKHSEVITYVSKLKMCGVTLSMLVVHGFLLISTVSQVILQPLMFTCTLKNNTVDQCLVYSEAILYSEFFMNFNYVIIVVVYAICIKSFRLTALDLCDRHRADIQEKPPESQSSVVTHAASTSHK